MKKLIILLLLATSTGYSQETRGHAQQLRDGAIHLGLLTGVQFHNTVNSPTIGYNYSLDAKPSVQIGLDWNYAATGRFLFNFSTKYEKLDVETRGLVPGSFFNTSEDLVLNRDRAFDIYTFNFKFDFVQKLHENHFISFGVNVNSRLLTDNDSNRIGLTFQSPNNANAINISRSDDSPVFITFPISLTYTYKNGKLGNLSGTVLYSFEDDSRLRDFVFKNDVENQNFSSSEHFLSTQALNLSLSWFPPRQWFSKAQPSGKK
jgi:hypothetical protein